MKAMKLYVHGRSGNCYKTRLICAHLGLAYEVVDVGPRAEGRSAEFLKLNPAGRVPVLELHDGRVLPESNAILCYLAEGTYLMPEHTYDRAQVLQWMFFEQNLHEPYLATLRLNRRTGAVDSWTPDKLELFVKSGDAALDTMEEHLAGQPSGWFAAGRYTICDIALFGYTHVADEAGFDLSTRPHVQKWLQAVTSQPGWLPLADLATA